MKYEIRQIDAWNEGDSWTWNSSFHIGEFTARSDDHKKSFLRALHERGVHFKRGAIVVEYDGDVYEVCYHKTGEPLFAAIPMM